MRITKTQIAKLERKQAAYLWGQKSFIRPVFIRQSLGDGNTLLAMTPLNTRPNHYFIRIDSKWLDKENTDLIYDHLDEIYGNNHLDTQPLINYSFSCRDRVALLFGGSLWLVVLVVAFCAVKEMPFLIKWIETERSPVGIPISVDIVDAANDARNCSDSRAIVSGSLSSCAKYGHHCLLNWSQRLRAIRHQPRSLEEIAFCQFDATFWKFPNREALNYMDDNIAGNRTTGILYRDSVLPTLRERGPRGIGTDDGDFVYYYPRSSILPIFGLRFGERLRRSLSSTLSGFGRLIAGSPLESGEDCVEDRCDTQSKRGYRGNGASMFRIDYEPPKTTPRFNWIWLLVGLVGVGFVAHGFVVAAVGYFSFANSWSTKWIVKGLGMLAAGWAVGCLGFYNFIRGLI